MHKHLHAVPVLLLLFGCGPKDPAMDMAPPEEDLSGDEDLRQPDLRDPGDLPPAYHQPPPGSKRFLDP